MYAGKR